MSAYSDFKGGDAPVWMTGKVYPQFKRVVDPVDGRKFWRRTAAAAGATRPALDFGNWSLEGFPKAGAINVAPLVYFNTNGANPAQGACQVAMQRAGGIGDLSVQTPATADTYVTVLALTGRGIVDGAFGFLEGLYSSYAVSNAAATLRVTVDEKVSAEIALPQTNSGSTGQGSYASIGSLIQFVGGFQGSTGTDLSHFPIGWNLREVPFERLFKVEVKSPTVNRPFHLGIRYALQD